MTYQRDDPDTWSVLKGHLTDHVDLSDAAVLDVGCGSGGLSEAMSTDCTQLATTDLSAAHVRESVEKSHCEDTIGCQLDAAQLPFRADHFDLVILNGVLEWVPLASDDDPRDRQVQALHEVNRVLRPGGTLYLGIETRYYAPFTAGLPNHDGLPFDQLLPRSVADVYYQLLRGCSHKTYLHTVPGYRRMLHEAGFADVDVASTLPTYKAPQRIVPLSEMDEIRDAITEVDEAGWRKTIRRLLAVHPKPFELLGTELGILARTPV